MQSLAYKWLAATMSQQMLISSLSLGAEQFTGYPAHELVGRPITQILADESVFELPRMIESAGELGYWEGEIVHRTRGGQAMEARGVLSALAGAGDISAGYLLISSFKNTGFEESLGDPAITEVAGRLRTFAHDMNNPLAVIMGFTQLAIMSPECQGKFRKDMEKVYSELKRVIETVERLHSYAVSLCSRPQRESSLNSA
ncbi:MAG: hypothetical protein GXX84_05350 [Acidobacteria bacterium]|nr:hypothetical protein [Acidobacteriota bacterium]